MSRLSKTDPAIAEILQAELHRQQHTLELIASENHVSPAILEATGSVLTDKYAEGYPSKRWYRGCHQADRVERLCIKRALKLFGAEYANVQPHSGTSANLAVYVAALKPVDKIMGMRLDQGGHLSHGKKTNLSGICYQVASYGVRKDTETLDMDEVRDLARRERPNMLVVGASAYSRTLDFAAF
ncbi:MAG: serine hydroxymethyltransferase, partial [Phycisphaerae bacterium]|nr:serine hydroxymethyltransferase [Phycisphaerae bacterium]